MSLAFGVHPALVVLLLLAAAAIASVAYRTTLPPVPRRLRIVLTLLRAASLALLFILLTTPVLRLTLRSVREPVLAVLVDNSRSMRIVDGAGDRASILRALLHDSLSRIVPPGDKILVRTFGAQTLPAAARDTFALRDAVTDIAAALTAVRAEHERTPFRAALMFTDGNATAGNAPLGAADLPFPLFTIGVGDSSEPRDLLVTGVVANEVVYAGTATPVLVRVKSAGYDTSTVVVTLTDGLHELARARLTLSPGVREYAVELSTTLTSPGMQRLRAAVSPLPGELTRNNNVMPFTVRVLKSRLHVLLLAGAPGPDLAIIRQTLAEDKDFEVHSFCGRSDGSFFEGDIPPSLLDSLDAAVTVGFPTRSSPRRALDLLGNLLERRSLPLLFIGGPALDQDQLQRIGPSLPFTPASLETAEQLVFARPDPAQRSHQILSGDIEMSMLRLPPLYRTASTYTARPGSTVLARAALQNTVLPEPLIVGRSVGKQKSLAILAYGVWRWRLMAQNDQATAQFFPLFLSTAVRWLTTPNDLRRVHARTYREDYAAGEPVVIDAHVLDTGARPLDGARVRVRAEGAGRIAETEMVPSGNGRYTGALEGLSEGDYRFRATAMHDSAVIGADDGVFSIGGWTEEFRETRMNAPQLRQIAQQSGGRFVTPGGLEALASDLRSSPLMTPEITTEQKTMELRQWEPLLAVLVLLLGFEWFLRKRNGML